MCCGDVPLLTIDDSGHLRGLEDVVELLAGVGSDDQSRVVAAVRRARVVHARGAPHGWRGAHADPALGQFLARFALTDESLRGMVAGPPMADVDAGIASGRYARFDETDLSIASMIMGATVSAIWMVLEGHQAWREAGTDTAALVLRALGLDPEEARTIATEALPD
ncbi:hypothetical protein ACTHQ1_06015 [Janibacter anophelis]|uniref:hypothetical protein n=1 Tax=Janibacter anophelis TaxID=319054 RepID=UPI003F81DCC6